MINWTKGLDRIKNGSFVQSIWSARCEDIAGCLLENNETRGEAPRQRNGELKRGHGAHALTTVLCHWAIFTHSSIGLNVADWGFAFQVQAHWNDRTSLRPAVESPIGGTLTNYNSPASPSIPVVCLCHTTRWGGLELVSASWSLATISVTW